MNRHIPDAGLVGAIIDNDGCQSGKSIGQHHQSEILYSDNSGNDGINQDQ